MHSPSSTTLRCCALALLACACTSERAARTHDAAHPTAPGAAHAEHDHGGTAASNAPAGATNSVKATSSANSTSSASSIDSYAAARSGGERIVSNAGTYEVVYRSVAKPFPRGEPFALDVWVFSPADREHPLTDVRVSVDAAMPTHGHGMNRVARIEAAEAGRFHVEGMLLHMPGPWQMYFDVTRGALSERAQIAFEVE